MLLRKAFEKFIFKTVQAIFKPCWNFMNYVNQMSACKLKFKIDINKSSSKSIFLINFFVIIS